VWVVSPPLRSPPCRGRERRLTGLTASSERRKGDDETTRLRSGEEKCHPVKRWIGIKKKAVSTLFPSQAWGRIRPRPLDHTLGNSPEEID
jgi:hypothetical protein